LRLIFKFVIFNQKIFFFFFSLNKQNVLTRLQLKLDWLETCRKTSICIVVETGFLVSLVFLRPLFVPSLIGRTRNSTCTFSLSWKEKRKEEKRPRETFQFSLFFVTFPFAHIKMALKLCVFLFELGNWKALDFTSRERESEGILMEINLNWIHAITSRALSFLGLAFFVF
jgi:hypothetical protein